MGLESKTLNNMSEYDTPPDLEDEENQPDLADMADFKRKQKLEDEN